MKNEIEKLENEYVIKNEYVFVLDNGKFEMIGRSIAYRDVTDSPVFFIKNKNIVPYSNTIKTTGMLVISYEHKPIYCIYCKKTVKLLYRLCAGLTKHRNNISHRNFLCSFFSHNKLIILSSFFGSVSYWNCPFGVDEC